jgi:hypothetical protein
MGIELEFSIDDIKPAALRRMLTQAIRTEGNRSKPLHKRKSKEELEVEDDDATEEADDEMDKLADLSEEQKGKASDVPMEDEDMSDEAMDELPVKEPKTKKKPPKGKA